MDKSMAELGLRAQAGDQSAVSQLYERSYSSVYQAVRALIQDEDQAFSWLGIGVWILGVVMFVAEKRSKKKK